MATGVAMCGLQARLMEFHSSMELTMIINALHLKLCQNRISAHKTKAG